MTPERTDGNCPNCRSCEIVEGRLLDVAGIGSGTAFRPKGRGVLGWFFRRDARLRNPVFVCSTCGMLWTFVDPARVVNEA